MDTPDNAAFDPILESLLTPQPRIVLEVFDEKIDLQMPKNEADTDFVKAIEGAQWDEQQQWWTIPYHPSTLTLLTTYFGIRLTQLLTPAYRLTQVGGRMYQVNRNEVLIIRHHAERLKIFVYDPTTLERGIKRIPFWRWDNRSYAWALPFSAKVLAQLTEIAQQAGLQVKYQEE